MGRGVDDALVRPRAGRLVGAPGAPAHRHRPRSHRLPHRRHPLVGVLRHRGEPGRQRPHHGGHHAGHRRRHPGRRRRSVGQPAGRRGGGRAPAHLRQLDARQPHPPRLPPVRGLPPRHLRHRVHRRPAREHRRRHRLRHHRPRRAHPEGHHAARRPGRHRPAGRGRAGHHRLHHPHAERLRHRPHPGGGPGVGRRRGRAHLRPGGGGRRHLRGARADRAGVPRVRLGRPVVRPHGAAHPGGVVCLLPPERWRGRRHVDPGHRRRRRPGPRRACRS